jgi:RNA polymerase primary sigma factor
MSTNVLPKLQEWELRLKAQIPNLTLLGELDLSADECRELGQIIGTRFRNFLSPTDATNVMWRNYPCVIAAYLVAQGMYGYELGNYWTDVEQLTGLPVRLQSEWGQRFIQFLEGHQLPTFPSIQGQKYVGVILCHGGIPKYSLPDFFQNLLQPSLLRPEFDGLSIDELIVEWLEYTSGRHFTDKPVLRFLKHGGRIATDFVARTREMALRHFDTQCVPSAEEVGLPRRIVDAYSEWVTRHNIHIRPATHQSIFRVRSPTVLLDPWGGGIVLQLPEQHLFTHADINEVVWEVTAGSAHVAISLRARRMNDGIQTTAQRVPLDELAQSYRVRCYATDILDRAWEFRGPTPQRPLIVFEGGSGQLLQWRESLPAQLLWLVFPRTHQLLVDSGKRVEVGPHLPAPWSGYQVELWDLSRVNELKLADGPNLFSFVVDVGAARTGLTLVGGTMLFTDMERATPIYIGEPPSLRVPLGSGRIVQAELGLWRLRIRNDNQTTSPIERSSLLSDLQNVALIGDGYADIPLRIPQLLDTKPFGTFTLSLRGRLGHDTYLPMHVIPALELQGHERLHIPDPKTGARPAVIQLKTRSDIDVSSTDETACQVQALGNGMFTINVKANAIAADVMLHTTQAEMLLHIPVRRLRWTLHDETVKLTTNAWTDQPLRYSQTTFLQSAQSALLVAVPLPPRCKQAFHA